MTIRLVLLMLGVPLLWAGEQDVLVKRLEGELLSPCCYRQSVAEHGSADAAQMRAEIERLVVSGRSEREVVDLYKALYGMRILGEPEGPIWWIATLIPTAVTVAGIFLLARFLRSFAQRQESGPANGSWNSTV